MHGIADFVEETMHHPRVFPVVAENASPNHALVADNGEIKIVPRLLRQFADKEALRPSLAFAKRMHAVKLNHHSGGAMREFFAAKAPQIVFIAEFSGNAIQSAPDQRTIHERLAVRLAQDRLGGDDAMRQQHALVASSACPFVNILKKMAVNGFQMRSVKISLGTLTVLEFPKPISDVICFDNLERCVAGRPKPVLERQSVL
jgi:hypothetical protein